MNDFGHEKNIVNETKHVVNAVSSTTSWLQLNAHLLKTGATQNFMQHKRKYPNYSTTLSKHICECYHNIGKLI